MASQYELTFNDNTVVGQTPEKGRMRLNIVDITAGNLAATQTQLAALLTAIEGIVLGVLNRERIVLSDTLSSSAPAASNLAQREIKWLVTYTDTVTHRLFKSEIPTAKISLLTGNSESLDLAAGEGLAFKTAFEAVVKSIEGNAVQVISVKYVGRKS